MVVGVAERDTRVHTDGAGCYVGCNHCVKQVGDLGVLPATVVHERVRSRTGGSDEARRS